MDGVVQRWIHRGSHVDHSAFGFPNSPVEMRAWTYQRPIQPNSGHKSAVRPTQLAGALAGPLFLCSNRANNLPDRKPVSTSQGSASQRGLQLIFTDSVS